MFLPFYSNESQYVSKRCLSTKEYVFGVLRKQGFE